MFVFLWLCIICLVLWLSHCVTVKPANQLSLQVEGQWETSLLRRGPAWWKNTVLVPCLRTSQWIPQVFLCFPHFLRPPQGYTGGAASPLSGPTSCFVKSHPRCTSVLTFLLCAILICSAYQRGPCPNLDKRLGGITTDPADQDVLHKRPQICLQQSALLCPCYTDSKFPLSLQSHISHRLFKPWNYKLAWWLDHCTTTLPFPEGLLPLQI